MTGHPAVEVNGRNYRWMDRPLVVVCVDGCEFDYVRRAVAAGVAPFLGRMLRSGAAFEADSVVRTWPASRGRRACATSTRSTSRSITSTRSARTMLVEAAGIEPASASPRQSGLHA